MEKYTFHTLSNSEYGGIVTILDYEIRLNAYLSELKFPSDAIGKKAIVDLALKAGADKYRFVSFDVDQDGSIVFGTNNYICVPKEIEIIANSILQEKKEIVMNSFLSENQKREILYEV